MDLPEPDVPTIATNSPFFTLKSTPSKDVYKRQMQDWAEHLDRILTMSGEQLLIGNGSITPVSYTHLGDALS